jgi:hypothetical protein
MRWRVRLKSGCSFEEKSNPKRGVLPGSKPAVTLESECLLSPVGNDKG